MMTIVVAWFAVLGTLVLTKSEYNRKPKILK